MARTKEIPSPPVIVSQPREFVVGAGSNISLSCSAHGTGPLEIIWFQDQQNLNTTRPGNGPMETPTSNLLLERRYEIAMELEPPNITHSNLYLYNLKLNDTGLFICSVKNDVGTSYTNHSLTVNDSPPAQLNGLHGSADYARRLWAGLSQSDTQLGVVAFIFVIILLAAVILLLIAKNYTSQSSKSSQSSQAETAPTRSKTLLGSLNLFTYKSTNKHHSSDPRKNDDNDRHNNNYRHDQDDNCSSSGSTSSCRKNSKTTTATADLEGFIEHLRSGIINMDYHTMSPVIQFNNNNNINSSKSKLNQAGQEQSMPFLDTVGHQMHHFPSSSNTSSLPYYGGTSGTGSVSMTTTTSNLSPSSGSANMMAYQMTHNGPSIINCDMQHRLNNDIAPPTNTTTTSYTSDYQSGYGEDPASNMMPPMYYETAPEAINYPTTNQQQIHNTMLLNGAFPVGVPTYLMLQQQQQQQQHHQHQHQHQQQLLLQQQHAQQQQLVAMHSTNRNARMLANRALGTDQDLSSSRPSLPSTR